MTKELIDQPIGEQAPRSSTDSKRSLLSDTDNGQLQTQTIPATLPEPTALIVVPDVSISAPSPSTSPALLLPPLQSQTLTAPTDAAGSPSEVVGEEDPESGDSARVGSENDHHGAESLTCDTTVGAQSSAPSTSDQSQHDTIDWPDSSPMFTPQEETDNTPTSQGQSSSASLPAHRLPQKPDRRLAASMMTLTPPGLSSSAEYARRRKAEMIAATQAVLAAARASRASSAASSPASSSVPKISDKESYAVLLRRDQTLSKSSSLVPPVPKSKAERTESNKQRPGSPAVHDVNRDHCAQSPPGSQGNVGNRVYTFQKEAEGHSPSKIDSTTRMSDMRRVSRRMNGIRELMETEEQYGKDLETLCLGFLIHIRDADFISQSDKDLLVRNSFDILKFQREFSAALREAFAYNETDDGNLAAIARCFQTWAPRFDIYIPYCVRQDQAMRVYNRLVEDKGTFLELVERMHRSSRTSTELGRRHLDDYFIMPFQRFFRYRLILQSISKTIEKHTVEYDELDKALEAMHAIGNQLNTEKAWMEAERKTALFLARLESDWTIPRRWHATLGRCVLIGTLDVRYGQKVRRHGCALFNTFMIVAKARKYKHTYDPRHWFPMRTMELENMAEHDSPLCHAWRLRHEKITLEFSAMCEQEKHVWIDAIKQTIDNAKKQYKSRGDETDVTEQLFVPSYEQHSRRSSAALRASPSMMSIYYPRQESIASHTQPNLSMPKSSTVSASLNRSADDLGPLQNDMPPPPLPPHLPSSHSSSQSPSGPSTSSSHPSHTPNDHTGYASIGTEDPSPVRVPPSPCLSAVSSMSDMRELFSNNVLSHNRLWHSSSAQCRMIDSKFEDVCTTPILTARSQAARHARRSQQMYKTASVISFTGGRRHTDEISYYALSPSTTTLCSPMPRSERFAGSFKINPNRQSIFGDMLKSAVRRTTLFIKKSAPT